MENEEGYYMIFLLGFLGAFMLSYCIYSLLFYDRNQELIDSISNILIGIIGLVSLNGMIKRIKRMKK